MLFLELPEESSQNANSRKADKKRSAGIVILQHSFAVVTKLAMTLPTLRI